VTPCETSSGTRDVRRAIARAISTSALVGRMVTGIASRITASGDSGFPSAHLLAAIIGGQFERFDLKSPFERAQAIEWRHGAFRAAPSQFEHIVRPGDGAARGRRAST